MQAAAVAAHGGVGSVWVVRLEKTILCSLGSSPAAENGCRARF